MSHPGTDEHVIIRSDFPGGWEGDQRNAFTGDGLTPQENDAQDFVRRLLQWRKTASVIHHGKLMHFAPDDNVYVFFRYNASHRVMVILNKNKEPYTLVLNPFYEMLKGYSRGTDVLTGKEYALQDGIGMDGAGPLILELR